MKKLSAAIIQPTVIAIGASIFLYAYNDKLPTINYFLHLPFWITIVRPTGLYWHSKFLKQINKGTFPSQMKSYREMYVVSKNAILYDVVLNHLLYHTLLTPALLGYMYVIKNYVQSQKMKQSLKNQANNQGIKQNKNGIVVHNDLSTIMKDSMISLIQGRGIISCASILSQYWISYASLKRQGSNSVYSLPTNIKRLLMAKQMLLSWSWTGLILKEFFKNYYPIKVQVLNDINE